MDKVYRSVKEKRQMLADPAVAYGAGYVAPMRAMSTRERVMASTVSVDEYFDELISLVHEDYAAL